MLVSIDDRKIYDTEAHLEGTVTVYTGRGGTIAVEELVIEGVPDRTRTVEGPSHTNYQ